MIATASLDRSTRPIPSALRALQAVLSPSGFPYGSNGHLFRDAQFGRDSLEVAEDLIDIRPDIARTVIVRLAELQGTTTEVRTEEEPGKIHHEYRATVMHGHPIGDESAAIYRHLARYWRLATTDEELRALSRMTYYGTVDATPLYVRLIAAFCARFGGDVLDHEYTPHHPLEGGRRPTIRDSVRAALNWIAGKIEGSDLGLLEWRRMSPRGHQFQAWKDGRTSYLHEDGSFANYGGPIASIEVQGLAYDALMAAGTLCGDLFPDERERWADLAVRLQRTTLECFWMPDRQYFAMAMDRDPRTGEARQVRLLTSNAGALLDSRIFESLTPDERRRYVAPVVSRIFGGEFLTPAGVRCSSLAHKDLQDYHGYQSSYTVWHKETYDIAKGLRRQGYPRLAEDLETRMLNCINLTGAPTEFVYAFPGDRVDYDPLNKEPRGDAEVILGTNLPENDQAWTISAMLAVKWRRGHRFAAHREGGDRRDELEDEILRTAGAAHLLRTAGEIVQERRNSTLFHVDTRAGWDREHAWVRAHEAGVSG